MGFIDWLGFGHAGKTLQLGDPMPDVTAPDENGCSVRLADLAQASCVLVFFFPKADTPGCTAQACSLRDEFDVLRERGVEVVGVSADSPAAQRRFRERRRLPYSLIADEKREVGRAFGVPVFFGMFRRQAFLFRQGKLVWRDLSASTRGQARDVLRELDKF